MSGKSTAAYDYIVALCKHDSTKRVGVPSEPIYTILKGRGVRDEQLFKIWEQKPEQELTTYWDEFNDENLVQQ